MLDMPFSLEEEQSINFLYFLSAGIISQGKRILKNDNGEKELILYITVPIKNSYKNMLFGDELAKCFNKMIAENINPSFAIDEETALKTQEKTMIKIFGDSFKRIKIRYIVRNEEWSLEKFKDRRDFLLSSPAFSKLKDRLWKIDEMFQI